MSSGVVLCRSVSLVPIATKRANVSSAVVTPCESRVPRALDSNETAASTYWEPQRGLAVPIKYESRRHEPDRRNPLAELIWEHMERTGETVSDIARRGGMPRQTVAAILYRPIIAQTPRPATITALAKGLRLSEEMVRERAAVAAMEFIDGDGHTIYRADEWRHDPLIANVVECMRKLDDEAKKVVLATARALVLGRAPRRTT